MSLTVLDLSEAKFGTQNESEPLSADPNRPVTVAELAEFEARIRDGVVTDLLTILDTYGLLTYQKTDSLKAPTESALPVNGAQTGEDFFAFMNSVIAEARERKDRRASSKAVS